MNTHGVVPSRTVISARVKRANTGEWEDLGVIADTNEDLTQLPSGGDSVKIECPNCAERTPTGVREDDEGPVGFVCLHCGTYSRGDMADGDFTVESVGEVIDDSAEAVE